MASKKEKKLAKKIVEEFLKEDYHNTPQYHFGFEIRNPKSFGVIENK